MKARNSAGEEKEAGGCIGGKPTEPNEPWQVVVVSAAGKRTLIIEKPQLDMTPATLQPQNLHDSESEIFQQNLVWGSSA